LFVKCVSSMGLLLRRQGLLQRSLLRTRLFRRVLASQLNKAK
jgi:hypothetical protein